MNKKEIAEIKKQFTPANCAITRICGCYVNGEKEKVTRFTEAFLSLPEEDIFKYFEIIRKTLSGTIGKNLLNMDFPLATEKEGGTQEFLLQLRNSQLKDQELLSKYYDKIISSFIYGENYLILLLHSAYDVPGKSSDNTEMFDASDEVYNFIISCICPVKLEKPALSYNMEEKCFQNRIRDWIVEMPMLGFLFPAFNDRSTDLHSVLYYSKNAEELHFDFTDSILGCTVPLSAESQKEAFQTIIEETLGENCDYEVVRNIHENLIQIIEEHKDNPEPMSLGQSEVRDLLANSGVEEEQLEEFDNHFVAAAGVNTSFMATNITNAKKYEVRTPDVIIQVNPERTDLVETRIMDGKKYLVIPINEQITVNGISVQK